MTLESLVAAASRRALAAGALVSIPTRETRIQDGEFTYLVRVVGQLSRKAAASTPTPESPEAPVSSRRNPFLPYDPDLFVADLPPAHVCLLNKFNVVDQHVLVVTREFERQTSPLNEGDFAALASCMLDGTRFSDGLGFYNGGAAAGASQPHKHLQWIPVRPSEFPLTHAIAAAAAAGESQSDRLPFANRIERLTMASAESPEGVGERLAGAYRRLLLATFGLPAKAPASAGPASTDPTSSVAAALGRDFELPPYNLLVARNWMMMVPRRQEHFREISLNALAFVGALLVKDERQLQVLRETGPCAALAAAAPRV